MDHLHALQSRYQQYFQELAQAKAESPAGGYLGLGADPRKHPCNKAFYQDVGAIVADFLAQDPPHEEILAFTEYILKAPMGQEAQLSYGYLFAAQGHCRLLIPYLTPEERASIWQWYDKAFPPAKRLPVQDELATLLSGKRPRRRFFSGLFSG